MPHKLLLADDSVTIQRVIELTFAGEDVEVIAVGDGQKAIDRIGTDRPDIVLTDIGMPERNGYEVAEFVKTHPDLKHIPVVLLTGAFESVDEARVRAIGCDGWLVKPFEPQLVINRVRDLLQGRGSGAQRTPPPGQRPASKDQAAEQPGDAPTTPPSTAPERPPSSTAARPSPAPAVRSRASAPTTIAGRPKSADAMEEYFDRLDAAFANLDTPHSSQFDDRQVEDGRDRELHRGEPSGSQKPGEQLENQDPDTFATDDSAPQTSDLAAASDSDRTAASPTQPRAPSVQPAPPAPPVRQASSAPPVPPAPPVRQASSAPPVPPAPPVRQASSAPPVHRSDRCHPHHPRHRSDRRHPRHPYHPRHRSDRRHPRHLRHRSNRRHPRHPRHRSDRRHPRHLRHPCHRSNRRHPRHPRHQFHQPQPRRQPHQPHQPKKRHSRSRHMRRAAPSRHPCLFRPHRWQMPSRRCWPLNSAFQVGRERLSVAARLERRRFLMGWSRN